MSPTGKKRRSRKATQEARKHASARLTSTVPALSGDLVEFTDTSPSLFQAINLWQFGDWAALAKLGAVDGDETRKAGKVALLSASANLQRGTRDRAGALLKQAMKAGCSKTEIASILVAGAHINLGRASYLIGRSGDGHSEHFQQAATAALGRWQARSTARAIESEQLSQLGVPTFWRQPDPSQKLPSQEGDRLLKRLTEAFPSESAFQAVAAERLQRRGENSKAILAWQKAAELMGQDTPQTYYDRLAEAYKTQGSFPAGKPADEQVRGGIDKYEVLRELHGLIRPRLYLEIGVQSGKSLALAKCEAVGVDPMPMLNVELPKTARIARVTSDEFFARYADSMLPCAPDLVFIDGMHLFEYALRDFMNVERYSTPGTVVAIDDIFPNSQAQAARERVTRAWTGDVWKVFDVLRTLRPDLYLQPIDAGPTGLLLISRLDASSTVLSEHYSDLTERYIPIETVPEAYIGRVGAHPGIEKDAFFVSARE